MEEASEFLERVQSMFDIRDDVVNLSVDDITRMAVLMVAMSVKYVPMRGDTIACSTMFKEMSITPDYSKGFVVYVSRSGTTIRHSDGQSYWPDLHKVSQCKMVLTEEILNIWDYKEATLGDIQ